MLFFFLLYFWGEYSGVSSLPNCRFSRVENFRSLFCIGFLINLLDLFSECKNYQILSSANRKVTHGSSPLLCDQFFWAWLVSFPRRRRNKNAHWVHPYSEMRDIHYRLVKWQSSQGTRGRCDAAGVFSLQFLLRVFP